MRIKSPAAAGLLESIRRLLLLAEALVAAAARLADRADLRLDRRFVAAAAHRVELGRFVLQAVRRFRELRAVAPHGRQRRALHILGAVCETVPGHAAQVVEEAGVA